MPSSAASFVRGCDHRRCGSGSRGRRPGTRRCRPPASSYNQPSPDDAEGDVELDTIRGRISSSATGCGPRGVGLVPRVRRCRSQVRRDDHHRLRADPDPGRVTRLGSEKTHRDPSRPRRRVSRLATTPRRASSGWCRARQRRTATVSVWSCRWRRQFRAPPRPCTAQAARSPSSCRRPPSGHRCRGRGSSHPITAPSDTSPAGTARTLAPASQIKAIRPRLR